MMMMMKLFRMMMMIMMMTIAIMMMLMKMTTPTTTTLKMTTTKMTKTKMILIKTAVVLSTHFKKLSGILYEYVFFLQFHTQVWALLYCQTTTVNTDCTVDLKETLRRQESSNIHKNICYLPLSSFVSMPGLFLPV